MDSYHRGSAYSGRRSAERVPAKVGIGLVALNVFCTLSLVYLFVSCMSGCIDSVDHEITGAKIDCYFQGHHVYQGEISLEGVALEGFELDGEYALCSDCQDAHEQCDSDLVARRYCIVRTPAKLKDGGK